MNASDHTTAGRMILNEPEAIYFRRELDVASNSGLKLIDEKSAAHYKHWCDHPEDDPETDAFDFGHGLHHAVLEPHLVDKLYAILPPGAPNRPSSRQINAKRPSPETVAQIDWWADFNNIHGGKTILDAKEYDAIRGMVDSMRNQVLVIPQSSGKPIKIKGGELFDLCEKEVTLRWVDERTGVKCKARADLSCKELQFGGDVKSTIDASPEGFARAVTRYRYHQQHVHYTDGAKACGAPWGNFFFFACEKARPHVPAVYHIPAMAEERGRELRDRALDKLKKCLDSGRWSGYSETITELVLPVWAYYE